MLISVLRGSRNSTFFFFFFLAAPSVAVYNESFRYRAKGKLQLCQAVLLNEATQQVRAEMSWRYKDSASKDGNKVEYVCWVCVADSVHWNE